MVAPSLSGTSTSRASRRCRGSRSIASSSWSTPSPVSAETGTGARARRRREVAALQDAALTRAAARRSCSAPRSSARPPPSSIAPSSLQHRPRRRRAGARVSGWAMSRTCTIRSASSTSSRVARKAATRWVGRSETKPTVSEITQSRPSGSLIDAHGRIERGEQQVLGEHVGAGQAVEQRRLAGVGVADQRHRRQARLARGRRGCTARVRRTPSRSRLMRTMRSPIRRRSISIWISPGPPRKPKPPRWRSKMGPGPHQPAALVVERGQLDLQAAFMRAGARAEDLQDQAGAVDDLGVPGLLEVALLHRRQLVVDDDQLDLLLFDRWPSGARPRRCRSASPA